MQFWFRLLPDPRLAAEHRAAAAIPSVTLELAQCDDAFALRPVHPDRQTEHHVESVSIDHRLTAALAEGDQSPKPLPNCAHPAAYAPKTLYARLAVMTADEIVTKCANAYSLAAR